MVLHVQRRCFSPNVVIKPLHLVKSEKLPIPHWRPKQPYEGPRTGRQCMGRSGPHTGCPHGPPKITEMWLLGFFPCSIQLPQPIGDPSRPTPAPTFCVGSWKDLPGYFCA